MTKQIHHTLDAGKTCRLDINGTTVYEFTVPDGKLLTVKANEVAIFDAGTRLEVYLNGTKRLNYTVPNGFAVLVETELEDDA